jgi:hypothetical protein
VFAKGFFRSQLVSRAGGLGLGLGLGLGIELSAYPRDFEDLAAHENLEPRKTNSTATTAGEAPRWARSGLVLASRLRDRGDRSKAEEFASIFAADGLGDRRSHHMPWVACTMPWSRTTDDP